MIPSLSDPRVLTRRDRQSILMRLSEAQQHRCAYCGRDTWIDKIDPPGAPDTQATFEHVFAKTECRNQPPSFDRHAVENLCMACFECNNVRGDAVSAEEFYWIRRKPGRYAAFRRHRGFDISSEEREARRYQRLRSAALRLALIGVWYPGFAAAIRHAAQAFAKSAAPHRVQQAA